MDIKNYIEKKNNVKIPPNLDKVRLSLIEDLYKLMYEARKGGKQWLGRQRDTLRDYRKDLIDMIEIIKQIFSNGNPKHLDLLYQYIYSLTQISHTKEQFCGPSSSYNTISYMLMFLCLFVFIFVIVMLCQKQK